METRHDDEFGPLTAQGSDEWRLERTVLLGGAPIPIEVRRDGNTLLDPLQRQAIRSALALDANALEEAALAVVQNYEVYREMIGDDEMPPLEKPMDVWQQVRLSHISVASHREVQHAYFLLHAECDWDPEHGLEVRFRDGVAIECDQEGGTSGTADDSPERLEMLRTLIADSASPRDL